MRWRLEAVQTILRQSIQADDGHSAGVDVTMLVTVSLDALKTGIGAATIAGVDEPVSARTARRLACEARVIPQVLDGRSVVLDQGMGRRTFSKHQRYALHTSSGCDGCAFPGCEMPFSMTEVHHVQRWWDRDRHGAGSDLSNGVLLCGLHNRLMEQGWDYRVDDRGIWFVPPATIDPAQTPILGGGTRAREVA